MWSSKIKCIIIILIFAMIAGLSANLIDSCLYSREESDWFLDRLDQLIHAVEMDYGR